MAWYRRSPVAGLIFHSDRGSQYVSRCYTDLLAGHAIKASMSRKGNCWDNACSETLFGSLKVERLRGIKFHSHRGTKDAVMEWLLWYNQSRLHSTLGYLSQHSSSSKRTQNNKPSQPDREGSTPAG